MCGVRAQIGNVAVEEPSPPRRAPATATSDQANAEADAAAIAAADAAAEQQIESLKAMFPDLDKDIIEAILAETGSVERAVQGLLDVSSPATEAAPGYTAAGAPVQSRSASSSIDADAQLALALFQEFADSLDSRCAPGTPARWEWGGSAPAPHLSEGVGEPPPRSAQGPR